ncbi:MAG: hypothetical protein ABIS36_16255 [Chryseolinea sp.]
MNTVGYHTVENRDVDKIDDNAPFISAGSKAYLGIGYYFWDDDEEWAHWWGEHHCKNEYIICRANLTCAPDRYLDLHGNQAAMRLMKAWYTIYKNDFVRNFDTARPPLGVVVEFLKKLAFTRKNPTIFPFDAVRAEDSYLTGKRRSTLPFAVDRPGQLTLNPALIVCLYRKRDLCRNLEIIFPEEYVI